MIYNVIVRLLLFFFKFVLRSVCRDSVKFRTRNATRAVVVS